MRKRNDTIGLRTAKEAFSKALEALAEDPIHELSEISFLQILRRCVSPVDAVETACAYGRTWATLYFHVSIEAVKSILEKGYDVRTKDGYVTVLFDSSSTGRVILNDGVPEHKRHYDNAITVLGTDSSYEDLESLPITDVPSKDWAFEKSLESQEHCLCKAIVEAAREGKQQAVIGFVPPPPVIDRLLDKKYDLEISCKGCTKIIFKEDSSGRILRHESPYSDYYLLFKKRGIVYDSDI